MDKFDRMQMLHRIFSDRRRPVSVRELAQRLECTEKTIRRAIEFLRDFFNAPLEYSSQEKGWRYVQSDDQFQLPGLWMTGEELQSLILLLHVLEGFGNGLLNKELASVEQQIHRLLQARGISPNVFSERIKALPIANKLIPNQIFIDIGEALIKRHQLTIHYTSYSREKTVRAISPQNLVYYRENWYVDAWCHLRNDLRTFTLARITAIDKDPAKKPVAAKQIPKQQLHDYFATSYGLFAGKPTHVAKLRFAAAIAYEISQQQWHPTQIGGWDKNDYLLDVPYSDDRELVGDILKHMPHVVVEGPPSLRKAVVARLRGGLKLHE